MKHPIKKDDNERPAITQADLLMAEDRALRVGDFLFEEDRSPVSGVSPLGYFKQKSAL